MLPIISENQVKRINPALIDYNGSKYIYVMNVGEHNVPSLEKAAERCDVRIILMREAFDINAHVLPDSYAVYFLEDDYKDRTNVSNIIKVHTDIINAYRRTMIEKGIFREDTPLSEVYIGCENDPNFKYLV